eukprot:CAMPEP_0197042450 /NCGR_PEP_ID=MMETSP1384-20130603/18824_1 /TAXON_ID=29189 /ORGANISM="Ammonia sp." /LENGTH=134 /DNA_ID=CAMNT_0042473555 /DNA_START=316 /DNA_END=720 /DNA_ORIENTATION=+
MLVDVTEFAVTAKHPQIVVIEVGGEWNEVDTVLFHPEFIIVDFNLFDAIQEVIKLDIRVFVFVCIESIEQFVVHVICESDIELRQIIAMITFLTTHSPLKIVLAEQASDRFSDCEDEQTRSVFVEDELDEVLLR